MSLQSETGTVQGNEITFDVTTKGAARGIGVIAYIDYTKGVSDTLTFKQSFKELKLSDNYFYDILITNDVISSSNFELSTSGKFRFPLSNAYNEDSIKLEFTGLVDGDLHIEFSLDQNYN